MSAQELKCIKTTPPISFDWLHDFGINKTRVMVGEFLKELDVQTDENQ